MQLYQNGGNIFNVNYRDVGVATLVGGVSGFVAPVAAPGIIGAIGLGGISNIAQTGLSNWLNGRPTCSRDVLNSAWTGALGGAIGGGTGYAPSGRTVKDAISDVADRGLARRVNEGDRARTAVGFSNFARGVLGGIVGNW